MPSTLFARAARTQADHDRVRLQRELDMIQELGDEYSREGDRVSASSCYARARVLRNQLQPRSHLVRTTATLLGVGVALGRAGLVAGKVIAPVAACTAFELGRQTASRTMHTLQKHASYLRFR